MPAPGVTGKKSRPKTAKRAFGDLIPGTWPSLFHLPGRPANIPSWVQEGLSIFWNLNNIFSSKSPRDRSTVLSFS
jgi:hypothetical protein